MLAHSVTSLFVPVDGRLGDAFKVKPANVRAERTGVGGVRCVEYWCLV